jgi:hypothetical protein
LPKKNNILFITGLAFLITWLIATFYTVAAELNFLVTLPLVVIQVMTFMLITNDYRVGAVILSSMAVLLLVSVTVVYQPTFIFSLSIDAYFLAGLVSAGLHTTYGFVKKESKTIQTV